MTRKCWLPAFSPFSTVFSKAIFLRVIELKKFADSNFKFDENGRKLFKRVENTVGKGEIAHYEHFLLFPFQNMFAKLLFVKKHGSGDRGYSVFKRLGSQGHQKVSLCGKEVND